MALVCVECGAPVALLVRDYGKGNIRLAICGACNRVADKYVEYETVLLFLEVLLLRPQVYRHLLYNLPTPMDARTILKLFAILVMLDMNVKAYLIDRRAGLTLRSESMYQDQAQVSGLRVSQFSLHLVALALVENLAHLGAVLALVWLDPFARGWRARLLEGGRPVARYASAMVVSSFGKLFALLTVIWEYEWTFIHVIGGIVCCSNVLALKLLVAEQSSWRVVAVILGGIVARLGIQLLMFALGNSVLFHVLV